jgi:hypothetical protein
MLERIDSKHHAVLQQCLLQYQMQLYGVRLGLHQCQRHAHRIFHDRYDRDEAIPPVLPGPNLVSCALASGSIQVLPCEQVSPLLATACDAILPRAGRYLDYVWMRKTSYSLHTIGHHDLCCIVQPQHAMSCPDNSVYPYQISHLPS